MPPFETPDRVARHVFEAPGGVAEETIVEEDLVTDVNVAGGEVDADVPQQVGVGAVIHVVARTAALDLEAAKPEVLDVAPAELPQLGWNAGKLVVIENPAAVQEVHSQELASGRPLESEGPDADAFQGGGTDFGADAEAIAGLEDDG